MTSEPMDKVTLEILNELRKITRLLSLTATSGLKQKDQIGALSRAGFPPKEIADLLGTTPNTVRVTLARMKKRDGNHTEANLGDQP